VTARRPRAVLVTRRTPLQLLLERHGTLGQARFYVSSRGQDFRDVEDAHARLVDGLSQVDRALPSDQRRVHVDREQLDRFLFAPDDVVLMVGQDGLVANTAKYLSGQLAIGVNPDPTRYDGVLCTHPPEAVPALLAWLERGGGPPFRVMPRAMAVAEREDGQRLLALNEVFVGHRTHQSARYTIRHGRRSERHSSSGVLCATGTGATGWVRSVARQRAKAPALPAPEEPRLVFFVREPFPSVSTRTEVEAGSLRTGETLEIVSEMGEDGVVFGDGIESDRLEFVSGQRVRVSVARETLRLIVPEAAAAAAPGLVERGHARPHPVRAMRQRKT
jgi:hypothetical protein